MRVAAGGDQLPQLLGRADPAGEAAGHADDGDRLVAPRRREEATGAVATTDAVQGTGQLRSR